MLLDGVWRLFFEAARFAERLDGRFLVFFSGRKGGA
jgi:hypothetical protein